ERLDLVFAHVLPRGRKTCGGRLDERRVRSKRKPRVGMHRVIRDEQALVAAGESRLDDDRKEAVHAPVFGRDPELDVLEARSAFEIEVEKTERALFRDAGAQHVLHALVELALIVRAFGDAMASEPERRLLDAALAEAAVVDGNDDRDAPTHRDSSIASTASFASLSETPVASR